MGNNEQDTPSRQALLRAQEMLAKKQPPQQALALLGSFGESDPLFHQIQHLRAICVFRLNDPGQACRLLIDAIQRGEQAPAAYLNLAKAAARSGTPPEALALLRNGLERTLPNHFPRLTVSILENLGFSNNKLSLEEKDRVFTNLLLPVLAWLLKEQRMDDSINFENLIYKDYVRSNENESHFKQSMAQIAPLFSEAGRYWKAQLPALPPPPETAPYRIGFFVHSASVLAHVEVLLNTLKGYRQLESQPFEVTVYTFERQDDLLDRTLDKLDIRLVRLDELSPSPDFWERLLKFRERLSADGIHELVWVSLVTMMPLAFAMRMAPVQVWWAMKYHGVELPDIDGYLTGGSITKYRMIDGTSWRSGQLGVDDWYDASLEADAAAIRRKFGSALVLGSIGRTEKLADPVFLATIVRILKKNPQCVFLWPGRTQDQRIQSTFEQGGVSKQTHYIGWVNTRLFAQVLDVFLDSFPFPCGFSIFQAMAAGKPAIIFQSKESLETGLYAFIGPVLSGLEGTPVEQQSVREVVYGDGETPRIGIATCPEEYESLAQALIDNEAWRKLCGLASRNLMEKYLSSPATMGATHFQHLLEIMAGHYPSLAGMELKA